MLLRLRQMPKLLALTLGADERDLPIQWLFHVDFNFYLSSFPIISSRANGSMVSSVTVNTVAKKKKKRRSCHDLCALFICLVATAKPRA